VRLYNNLDQARTLNRERDRMRRLLEDRSMDQIYYTQCPVGYGVGASGGLQIKRHDASYPLGGDLRHLSLRAFLGTSRTLAPDVLRYRRDGNVAEIAKLSPREKEYQTERGLWGRPGGYFAHGLRLSTDELAAVANWPAGLWDWPHWKREDLEPSRGRPPDPITDPWPIPFTPPQFHGPARLASNKHPEQLAVLLTALAAAARDGRCLFLIDEAARLHDWVALLTFAFPEAFRAELTFSTFHDRPEELVGFRLQGVVPQVRPNRAALAGLGIVADAAEGAVSPPRSPARWAINLAEDLIRNDHDASETWERTNRLSVKLLNEGSFDRRVIWSDEWLDHFFAFDRSTTRRDAPVTAPEWNSFSALTKWSAEFGLAAEWTRARPPTWWRAGTRFELLREGRDAFLTQLGHADAWTAQAGEAVEWGGPFGSGFSDVEEDERLAAIQVLLESAPDEQRATALASALRSWPEDVASGILDRLVSHPLLRPAMRLPLSARGAVAALADRDDSGPLIELLRQAFEVSEALPATLSAIEAEIGGESEWIGLVSKVLGGLIASAPPREGARARAWGLSRGGAAAAAWLSGDLRRFLASPAYPDQLAALWKQTAPRLRSNLAIALLTIAKDPNLGRDAFPWVVENLLLVLPAEQRPREPSWADDYVLRVGSGYELARKLYLKETRHPELRRWIRDAHSAGWLGDRQIAQLARCQAFCQVLDSGDARSLRTTSLPTVPDADRGPLLEEMIRRLGHASFEKVEFCLDSCRVAWPGAFQARAPGLRGIGQAIAFALRDLQNTPLAWFERLTLICDRVHASMTSELGWEPDGLAAEVAAAAVRRTDGGDPWALRSFLLDQSAAWRILAADAALDLNRHDSKETLVAARNWDYRLTRGWRLFEVLLNSCDSEALTALVTGPRDDGSDTPWAAEFQTLPPLQWWRRPADGNNDLRDRFAREAPLSPLREESLPAVTRWLGPPRFDEASGAPPVFEGVDEPALVPIDDDPPPPGSPTQPSRTALSRSGLARWACLHALTAVSRANLDSATRWSEVNRWAATKLPVGFLDEKERRLFVAWMILRSDFWDVLQFDREDPALLRVAYWLFGQGMKSAVEVDAMKRWDLELIDRVDPSEVRRGQAFRPRFVDALWWCLHRLIERGEGSERKSPASRSPGA
jgi:GTPase-associated protein 1, middle domain